MDELNRPKVMLPSSFKWCFIKYVFDSMERGSLSELIP